MRSWDCYHVAYPVIKFRGVTVCWYWGYKQQYLIQNPRSGGRGGGGGGFIDRSNKPAKSMKCRV